MRKGLIVVSGCPRSGTSVTMDIQRAAHGEEFILGSKFPQENRKAMREKLQEQQPGESDAQWQVRTYLLNKKLAAEEAQMSEKQRDFRDMNPDGFWEMAFTVQGIIYKPQFRELLADIRGGAFKIAKVVSQGLLASDPMYIGKILYSIRHPRAVAKSQERLIRGFDVMGADGKPHNMFEGMVIHTPEMFIEVTKQAANFLLLYPEIPVRFHHFEDLVENPKKVIDDMAEFIGCGDYSKSYDIVKPSLNRSKHEDVESPLWEDAEYVYDNFCKAAEIINSYKGEHHAALKATRKKAVPYLVNIIQYLNDPKKNTNREKRHWVCYRAKRQVVEAHCKVCVLRTDLMKNFKKQSEATPSEHGVTKHWSEEPCVYECGLDLDRTEYLTIEESIANNFWKPREGEEEDATDTNNSDT